MEKINLMSQWDPSKLTDFRRYFDKDGKQFLTKYLQKCVNLLGPQIISLNVSLMSLN